MVVVVVELVGVGLTVVETDEVVSLEVPDLESLESGAK